jgi:hypothetical protein
VAEDARAVGLRQMIKKFRPFTLEGELQSHQYTDGWPPLPCFDALKISGADFGPLSQLLLSQTNSNPQADDVLPELFELFFGKLPHEPPKFFGTLEFNTIT